MKHRDTLGMKLALWGLLGSLNVGCNSSGGSSASDASTGASTTRAHTPTDGSGGSGGSGGSSGQVGDAISSQGASDGPTASTTTSVGGAAGAPGAAGTAGAAGAGPGGPPTCENFPPEDPNESCEPKLRALLRRNEGLLTFEYDQAGRISTVGDERSHASYVARRYMYDNQCRLSRIESDCEECTELYEFSHADAGWLQTMTREGSTVTYDEDGKVLENRSRTSLTRYRYRSDGQIEAVDYFRMHDDGVWSLEHSDSYDYGDDDLLDAVDGDIEDLEYSYVFEGDRMRVRRQSSYLSDDSLLSDYSVIFDDLGRPAFEVLDYVGALIGGVRFGTYDGSWEESFMRHRFDPPHDMFPYRPFDLTENDIDDFSYEYGDVAFERRTNFSAEGLLEHLSISLGGSVPTTLDVDVVRYDGVVRETIDFSPTGPDDVIVYYYGCDDFVLPTPLPEL